MKNVLYSNTILISLLILLSSVCCFAQQKKSQEKKFQHIIREFFMKKGEITNGNRLNVEAIEITDATKTLDESNGIFIIRTVYRTDGIDYLLFKNEAEYEILDLNNFAKLLDMTLKLFPNSDDDLLKYLPELTKWYYDNKRDDRETKFVKTH